MQNNNITFSTNKFICLLVSYTPLIILLTLSTVLSKFTYHDGWISMLIAGLYPTLFFLMFGYVFKYYPKKNIFNLNIDLLGNIIGRLFNILFFIYVFFYAIIQISGLVLVLQNNFLWYQTSNTTLIIILIISALSLLFNFKSYIKLSQILFYIACITLTFLVLSLNKGTILNITPIFDTPIDSILKASFYGIFAYCGVGIFLLYTPFISNKNDYKKISIKTTIILILSFVWLIFLPLYFFGADTLSAFYYPLLNVISSIKVPLFNSFIFVFLSIFLLNELKNSSLSLFNILFILSPKETLKVKKIWLIFVIPILFYISLFFNNIVEMVYFISNIFIPLMIIGLFNIFLLFLITLRRRLHEKHNL